MCAGVGVGICVGVGGFNVNYCDNKNRSATCCLHSIVHIGYYKTKVWNIGFGFLHLDKI